MSEISESVVGAGEQRREWMSLAPLAASCGLLGKFSAIDIVVGDEQSGYLEHLIHEIAHAVSLDLLPFTSHTSKEVQGRIELLATDGEEDTRLDILEETKAWAIEWLVWEEIGLTDNLFTWADLADAAGMQGCDDGDIEDMLHPSSRFFHKIVKHSKLALEEVRRVLGSHR
jgi:hypothetical protein